MPKYLDAVVILFVAVLAISVDVYPSGRSDVEETADFDNRTDVQRFELNASEGMSEARLRVRATVRDGAVSWRLTDPSGSQRLSGGGDDGTIRTDTGQIREPMPGIWILEMQFDDATGDYRVRWHAH